MTPLAIIAKEAGCLVSGSDVGEEFITDAALIKSGIVPLVGFRNENIKDPDLLIVTGAHSGLENIEAKTALEKGIKVISQGEAVGLFMDGAIFGKKFIGMSIAGTHGKTTTTGIIATILRESGFDPSFVIGTGDVGSLGAPGHFGDGKHFIAEADEYATMPMSDKKPKFLWQKPKIAVITNIEYDHPDVYSNIDDMRDAYMKLVESIDKNGVVIGYGDDPLVRKIQENIKSKMITYGVQKDNDYVLDKVNISGSHMFFTVSTKGMIISDFMINVVGDHNALNALAGIIACIESGVSIEKIKKGVAAFSGSKRRLEYVGQFRSGAYAYDDYAHHPTEIKKSLHALKMQYPNKKIIAVFQPHTYSRTKKLLEEFIGSFNDADTVLLTEIYPSLREEPDSEISSKILADRLSMGKRNIFYLEKLSDVVKYLSDSRFRSDTVVVTMGAGDVYKLHSQLKFV